MKSIKIPAPVTLCGQDKKPNEKPFPFAEFVSEFLLGHDMFAKGKRAIYAAEAIAKSVIAATDKGAEWWTLDEAEYKMICAAADEMPFSPAWLVKQIVSYYHAIDDAVDGLPPEKSDEAEKKIDAEKEQSQGAGEYEATPAPDVAQGETQEKSDTGG